jgi:uncharacterized protein YigE (DUF2233 family)
VINLGSRAAAALALLLLGCGQSEPQPNAFDPAALEAKPACESRNFEGTRFTICPFDSAKEEFRLVLNGPDGRPLRSLAALEQSLGRDASRVHFAMNAGMYDESGKPVGHYVENGKTLKGLNRRAGPGNFHLLPNGVFALDDKDQVHVMPTESFANTTWIASWATQSGPMLVIDGRLHPKFDADGESRLVRNGVGVKDARHAYFVIAEEGVSFGRFARLFRDALGCPNALYLDGTVSSLWDPGAGRQDSYSRLGPMLVVLRKGQASR